MADLYRKSSIEKLSNPEQLDRAITISSPLSWLALLGIMLIIGAVTLWSIFGKIPETQTVSGVIVDKADVCAIFSDKTGTVVDIKKRSGDHVDSGDVIAVIKSSGGKNFDLVSNHAGTLTDILLEKEAKVFSGNEIARLTPELSDDNVLVCYVPIGVGEQLNKDMDVLVYPLSADSQKYGHMKAKIEYIGEYAVTASNMQYVIGNDNMLADQFFSQGPVISVICKIESDSLSDNGYYWTNKSGRSVSITNGMLVSAKIVINEEAPIYKLFKGISNR